MQSDVITNTPPSGEDPPLLSTHKLAFAYADTDELVLQDVSVTIARKSFTAIVGRSGCGKTTLLNILAGFLQPCEGWSRLHDDTIRGPSEQRIPIFQVDALLPWLTLEKNVLLNSVLKNSRPLTPDDQKRARELLAHVGLDSALATHYPRTLSGGMKRRVELARALYAKPQVLLADEPFSSLDMDTQDSLHDLLRLVWKTTDITVVFSTHNLHEALYLATDIIVFGPTLPSSVARVFSNPFHGDRAAERTRAVPYFQLFDKIRSCMRGGLDG